MRGSKVNMANLEELYQQVEEKIKKLDFDKLWKGFKPLKYALYDNDECFFNGEYIEKTNEFCANTSIDYKGEKIAIWNVMTDMDIDVLASKMVHEMFHGFQMNENWGCFADEMEALRKYNYNSENLGIKLKENSLLLELEKKFESEKYKELLVCRQYRKEKFPYEFEYEANTEEIEGSANFVEWQVLKQLDEEKADKMIEEMKKVMTKPEFFFPIRISSYFTGALMINAAIKAGDHNYLPESRPYIMSVLNKTGDPGRCTVSEDDAISVGNALNAFNDRTKKIVCKALEDNEVLLEGLYVLKCVNVYDAGFWNGYITSRFILMYEENGSDKMLRGDFVVKVNEDGMLEKVYRWK